MHQGEEDEQVAVFSESFGQNLRAARAQKGWSQRELASALEECGVRLDPSAVTRIERGTREVKLREAATMADCLNVDLNELLIPQVNDPLSVAIELRRQAAACLRAAWLSVAQFGIQVQALTSLLDASPSTRDNFSKLRSRRKGLDVTEVIGFELRNALHELQQWIEESEVPVDERIADELQQTVVAAVDKLFMAKNAEGAVRPAKLPANWRSDAEA